MDINEYFLEFHARTLLEEARAARARAALVPSPPSARPSLAAMVAAARALFTRADRATVPSKA